MPDEHSPTTDRWRLTKQAAEHVAGGRRNWMDRKTEVPIWYRVLDRFGFPTFFGVVLLGVVVWQIRADREDRVADRAAYVAAMAEQTKAIRELATEVQKGSKR